MPRYTRHRSVLPTAPTVPQRIGRALRSVQGIKPFAAERWLIQRLLARLRGILVLVAILATLGLIMDKDYHDLVLPQASVAAEEVRP